jgi:GTP cyclohydrolase I
MGAGQKRSLIYGILGGNMAIDKDKIREHVRGILEALGDDPDREGLKDTPDRVARMYEEVFEGMNYTNDQIAEMFGKCFTQPKEQPDSDDMVIVKDIEVFSYCEHHMALMYDMTVSVAYIPNGKVIGLSKIARIADMVCRRLQLQERIGSDIAYIMSRVTASQDVAVIIKGSHSCMTARGIKNNSAKTVTTTLRGRFKEDIALQNRLMLQI